jgi:hypothetical protein
MLTLVGCVAMLLAGLQMNSRTPKPPPSEYFEIKPFDEEAWMRETRLLYSEWPGPPMPSEAELQTEMEKDRAYHLAHPTPPKQDAIRRWQEAQAEEVAKGRSHGNALILGGTLALILGLVRVLLGN